MACRRFIVSGRVQGVWFRASTREQAERLGLAGHALNRPDGSVEVMACGNEQALDALAAWLQHGPELAQVEHLHSEALPDQPLQGFRTG